MMPQGSGDRTVIVGGGLAGISAALALAKAGHRVTLLESRRRLGGRAGSFTRLNAQGEEEAVDYCQHVGMGCCDGLRQLIAWLGQQAEWEVQRKLHFYGPTGEYRCLSALPAIPAPLHLAGWLLEWPGLAWHDRWAIARGMWLIRGLAPDNPDSDRMSALEWLRTKQQTPRAIDNFWSTIVVSALGEQLERVSLSSVCKVLQDGFMNRRDAFHLLVPRRPLDELFNEGAIRVLRNLETDVRLSASVTEIEKIGGDFRVRASGEVCHAQHVICAVPWHKMAHIRWLEDGRSIGELKQLGAGLKGSPITGVHTWWDRSWLPTPHATIVGRLCQWVFPKPTQALEQRSRSNSAERLSQPAHGESSSAAEKPAGAILEQEHYYQIVISGSRDLTSVRSEQIGRMVQEDLKLVFPKSKSARLLRFKVVTDPQAVFSVSPGANLFRPMPRTPLDKLWLAGDWTRTGWPATMEGAILSGFAAAECVLSCHRSASRGENRENLVQP